MFVPKGILKSLYTNGSLANTADGYHFELKNRLLDATLVGVPRLAVDGVEVAPAQMSLTTGDGRTVTPSDVSASAPLPFELSDTFDIQVRGVAPLTAGTHTIEIAFDTQPFGALTLEVEDDVAA